MTAVVCNKGSEIRRMERGQRMCTRVCHSNKLVWNQNVIFRIKSYTKFEAKYRWLLVFLELIPGSKHAIQYKWKPHDIQSTLTKLLWNQSDFSILSIKLKVETTHRYG